jgi:hypothetical protein
LGPSTAKLAVSLHVTDGGLNRAAPFDHLAQAARDAAPHTRVINLYTINCTSRYARSTTAISGKTCAGLGELFRPDHVVLAGMPSVM